MALQNKRSPVHPGEILAEELQERGLSMTELSTNLGVPVKRIQSIVNERRNFSLE